MNDMLTKKEIDSLKPGTYTNTQLRKKFGKKHGTPVLERFTFTNKNSEEEQKDMVITGNRFQARWRRRNPLGELKVKTKIGEYVPVVTKQAKMNWLAKFMAWFNKLFNLG